MKNTGRNLLKDIKAGRDVENAAKEYLSVLATAFYRYSTIKLSLNLFTLVEMKEEIAEDKLAEYEEQVGLIKNALMSENFDINEVKKLRDQVTHKMKLLTTYTDALEIYEYILNRKEAKINSSVDDTVDIYELADKLFAYVFSDNDKLLVNSKIQTIIAQLPVRMTKNRFLDIICNTMSIYKGGETSSLDEFVEMLYSQAIIEKPEGFDSEYRDLYDIYQALTSADYDKIEKAEFDKLSSLINAASVMISGDVTNYLMLTEVINDLLIILITSRYKKAEFLDDKYEAAHKIIEALSATDNVYDMVNDFDEYFIKLEGAQEDAFEELSSLEANLVTIETQFEENEVIAEMSDDLNKADMLTSSSLFMDIESKPEEGQIVDDVYVAEKKIDVVAKFKERFKDISRNERRSIMAKVLAALPVFFNSQQEIKDYFEQTLLNCGDDSELTAANNILLELMEDN